MYLEVARVKALKLMIEHGLVQKGWKFAFNKRKCHLGLCSYGKKTIYLSQYYVELNEWEPEMKDTVLHEIAHALVGPSNAHNWIWQQKCREIGANPSRTAQYSDLKSPERKKEKKYVAICLCGQRHQIQRRGKYFNSYLCRRCRSKLSFRLNPEYGLR